mmetsp:Transcript_77394/g.90181  ORF Transcript_77394/g.90181 Transcript_77394/m.90181 type:complete len:423 (-) Transcript_77394:505-1773(-)
MIKMLKKTTTSLLNGTLAAVQKVLQRDHLLLVLDCVHLRLVVLQEQLRVGLQHRLQFICNHRAAQSEVANDVVQVANIHVEELVLGGTVHDREVLLHQKVLVELDVLELDVVEVSVQAGVQRHDGVHEVRGLLLVEQSHETGTTDHGDGLHLLSTDGIGGELAVLSEDTLQLASNTLHGDVLSGRSDTGHGQTNVDGGALTTSEQLRVKVNLAVGDGNHVGDDVSRHVVGQGLHNGQSCHGTATLSGGEHGSTLQQTRVQIEDITGVRLTTRGTAEQQRQLTVGNGLLGQIVVNAQAVTATVHEVLTHGHTGVWGKELQTSRLGSCGSHDRRVLQCTVRLQQAVNTGDVGATLANRHVNGNDGILRQNLLVHSHLVDDGRDGNRRLTRLTVTDNQLTLATTNGNHRVDGLEASEQIVVHRGA